MSTVGIVTDSISCLPAELSNQYGIRIVPLPLSIDGKSYRDQVDITTDAFWKLFAGGIKEFTTSAPSVGDITEILKAMGQSTNNIACILVSQKLSGTLESVVQARDMVKVQNPKLNIEVIDSKTAAGAEGFIVLEAARAAQAGKSLAEVVRVAQDMIPKVKFVVAMETLKYLIKGGRAPKTAYMGELFQVKPLIGMVSGTGLVENLGRARGKPKAVAKLLDLMKEYADTSKPLHIFVHYTDSIEDGEKLRDSVTTQFKCEEVYLTPYTPVMAGHTGPVVAVSFYSQ